MAGRGAVLGRYFFQQTFAEQNGFPEDSELSCFLLSSQPTLQEIRQRFPYEGTFHFRLQQFLPSSPHDNSVNGSNGQNGSGIGGSYCWVDLVEPHQVVPATMPGELRLKVLQISADEPEQTQLLHFDQDLREDQRYDAFFQWKQQQEMDLRNHRFGHPPHSNNSSRGRHERSSSGSDDGGGGGDGAGILHGVTKAFASRIKQSSMAQNLQKQTFKVFEKMRQASGANGGAMAAPPTANALAQLAKLMSSTKTNLSENNREHVDFLKRLWNCCFDQSSGAHFSPHSPLWSRLGFDHDDPLGELQVLLPLHCLVFFHEVHRAQALDMVTRQAEHSSFDYCYAEVATRIAFMLTDILQLHDGSCLGLERTFWRLFEDPIGFFELFSIVFRFFDESWLQHNADAKSKMELHMARTGEFAQELLARSPDSVTTLVDHAHQMLKW